MLPIQIIMTKCNLLGELLISKLLFFLTLINTDCIKFCQKDSLSSFILLSNTALEELVSILICLKICKRSFLRFNESKLRSDARINAIPSMMFTLLDLQHFSLLLLVHLINYNIERLHKVLNALPIHCRQNYLESYHQHLAHHRSQI